MNIDEIYMQEAIKNAISAYNVDEVPVGAIIVKNNEIIASTYNQTVTNNDCTSHAELLAIKEACKKLKTNNLKGCTLYVTFEPCIMCTGAIINSKIDKIVFGAYDNRFLSLETIILQSNSKNINHIPIHYGGVEEEKCSNLLRKYFQEKRIKSK